MKITDNTSLLQESEIYDWLESVCTGGQGW